MTTDLTTTARSAPARSLHQICIDTSRANCGECWALPGDVCVYTTAPVSVPVTKGTPVRPVRGYHVARFARAERRGLISAADFAAVLDMAIVFTPATVIYDEPCSPPEMPERGIGPGPAHLVDRHLIGPEDQVGALPEGTAACPATVTALATAGNRRTHVITVIVIIAVAYLFFHAGHTHANYRHGRAHGRRGVNLYWSSIRGPWIFVPGPFGTRIGHRL